jgi:hypothetical protein
MTFYNQVPQDKYGNVPLPWCVLAGHFEDRYGDGRRIFVIEAPQELLDMGYPDLAWPVYETSDPGPPRKLEHDEYLALLERDGVPLPGQHGDRQLTELEVTIQAVEEELEVTIQAVEELRRLRWS